MHPFFHHPSVRRCRIVFRWCRISVWLVILCVVAAGAYLHLWGLPDFLKRPLLQRWRAAGIVAQFSRMQLSWGPAILVDDVAFSRTEQNMTPQLTARQAELGLSWRALRHGQILPDTLRVDEAKIIWPISETNGDALLFDHVGLDAQFFSNDVVRVNGFRGLFQGVEVDLIGRVTHASELRNWRFSVGGGKTNRLSQARFRRIARTIEQIHFDGRPFLQIEAGADGRDMNSFHAEMNFAATGAHTPWGDGTNLLLAGACARLVHSGSAPFFQAQFSAEGLATPWAQGRTITSSIIFTRALNSNLDTQAQLEAHEVRVPLPFTNGSGAEAAAVTWTGRIAFDPSNSIPFLTTGTLQIQTPRLPWGAAKDVSLQLRAARSELPPVTDTNWGIWRRFVPWTLDCETELHELNSPKLNVARLAFSGHWRAPGVQIDNVRAELGRGHLTGSAALDIPSREFRAQAVSDADPGAISRLLGASVQDWLTQLTWQKPPEMVADLSLVLPSWTTHSAHWGKEAGATFKLEGDFKLAQSSFREIPFASVQGHFDLNQGIWNVTDIHAERPDGAFDLDFYSNSKTRDFSFIIDSRMDPQAVGPMLPERPRQVLGQIDFGQAPLVQGKIEGRWHDPSRLNFTGSIHATNVTVRGEMISAINGKVEFTNQILTSRDLSVSNYQCQLTAPWAEVDLKEKMVHLTNLTGAVDGAMPPRLLGAKAPEFMRLIRFDQPPKISVSGSFSLTNPAAMALRFGVDARGLHYTNFAADQVLGEVDWLGHRVVLTNIQASLYHQGSLNGWIVFDKAAEHGSDFSCKLAVADIDLPALVSGLTGRSNHIEGRLDGQMELRDPAANRGAYDGIGRVYVHNALLWDIKIFGLFTPVLNAISPGWGYSRAREVSTLFHVTNGVVSTDKLEVRFTGFRLDLHGSVDHSKHINALLEANLSKELPVLGPILNLAFSPLSKLFEYRLSGTLHEPVVAPVFIPKFVLALMRPFHTLKGMTTSDASPNPNPPAVSTLIPTN